MTDAPEWSSAFDPSSLAQTPTLPLTNIRDWAIGGSTGAGVKVAVIDSGIDADHPRVGGVSRAVALRIDPEAEDGYAVDEGPHDDLVGHGTACAAIIRASTPMTCTSTPRVQCFSSSLPCEARLNKNPYDCFR